MATARLQDWFYRNVWAPREYREGVNLENPRVPLNGITLQEALGGSMTSSGRTVGYGDANTISAVWRAMQIIEGVPASVPFQQFARTDTGRVQIKPSEHPVARMFSGRVNDKYTKPLFIERAVEHYLGWGNHIGLITWSALGVPEKIDLIHPKDVECFETDTKVAYRIKGEVVSTDRIIHVANKGQNAWGMSTIGAAREDLAFSLDTRDYGSTTMSKGGIPVGIFIPSHNVKAEQRTELQNNWKEAKVKNKAVALPFGWEYKQISLNPQDVAFIESNQFGITTIARWFGVPPQKLADMGRATWNNVESMGIEFLQDTITPLCTKFEAEYSNKLFSLPSEIDRGYYLEFNLDAYLRADSIAKAEAYSKYIQNAIKTPNEIRKYNNDESKPGGDDLFIQSGTIPITMIQQMLMSKTPAQRESLRKKIDRQLKDGIDPQLIIDGIFNSNGNGKH